MSVVSLCVFVQLWKSTWAKLRMTLWRRFLSSLRNLVAKHSLRWYSIVFSVCATFCNSSPISIRFFDAPKCLCVIVVTRTALRLIVPPVRLSGSRAFPVAAAAQIWNSVPEHIVSAPTLHSFRRHLKTFLMQQSFCLQHFSGPCSGFDHLGHSNNHWLIDWFILYFFCRLTRSSTRKHSSETWQCSKQIINILPLLTKRCY